MNSIRRSLVGFSLLCVILWAGAQNPAQADSPGPYYATPSWDQTLPAATRFIVLSNFAGAAVLDRNTGLVWERSPSMDQVDWRSGTFGCINKTVGGQNGWRLPSIPELASLVDSANSNPSLPTGHPFTNVQSAFYWSASTFAVDPTFAWLVVFSTGLASFIDKSSDSLRVWCVRGGMNADAY